MTRPREPVVVTIMPENLGAATHDADTTAGRLPVMGIRDAFALVERARGSSDHRPAPDVWSAGGYILRDTMNVPNVSGPAWGRVRDASLRTLVAFYRAPFYG